jgi:hypothetical protein
VDAESGPRRLGRRLGEIARGHGADEQTPVFYASLAMIDLTEDTGGDELEALILGSGAGFVVIDALADIMPGADENAVKDTQPVFLRLRGVAERTGAAIVLIHHTNKAGGYRGSSAMSGAVDLLLSVRSEPQSPNIDFETTKVRDTEPQYFSAVAHFDASPDPFNPEALSVYLTEAVKQTQQKLRDGPAFVLRYLEENEGTATLEEITSHADSCTENQAKRGVYDLAKMGLIFRVDAGGRGSKATYSIQKPEEETGPEVEP